MNKVLFQPDFKPCHVFDSNRVQFPLFGVRSNLRRDRSLDTPPKVANHPLPSHVDLSSFDCDPINEKENISFMDDNVFWTELDSGGCHDDELERQLPPAPPIQNVSCHGRTIRRDQIPKGIKRNVELFNSPYLDSDKELMHKVMNSNKKSKVSSMVTSKSGNKVKLCC